MLIETAREKEIDLGVKWPFPAQEKAKCLIPAKQMINLGVKEGDEVYMQFNMYWMLNAMIE